MVETTSEDEGYPIEHALQLGETRGWRAAEPGPQIIRILFDHPQKLKRIWLVFEETEIQRTQEFVLRWSVDHGRSFREIVRQQWNFSPPATIRERERQAPFCMALTPHLPSERLNGQIRAFERWNLG